MLYLYQQLSCANAHTSGKEVAQVVQSFVVRKFAKEGAATDWFAHVAAPSTSHPGSVEFSESPEYKAQLRFKMYSHSLRNKINQSRLKRQNEERADPLYQPQVEVLADQLMQDTYVAIIMWLSPTEIKNLMGPGHGPRAQNWRQSSHSRLVTYLGQEQTTCIGNLPLWEARQKALAKAMLTDVVSAMD